MTEPGSNASDDQGAEEAVELDLDEEKLEAWDAVKSDYEIDPDGVEVPNSMDGSAD
jgi:hypothetical protein